MNEQKITALELTEAETTRGLKCFFLFCWTLQPNQPALSSRPKRLNNVKGPDTKSARTLFPNKTIKQTDPNHLALS